MDLIQAPGATPTPTALPSPTPPAAPTPAPAPPPQAPPPQAPAPAIATTSSGSGAGVTLPLGAVVGAAVGGVVALAAAAGLTYYFAVVRPRRAGRRTAGDTAAKPGSSSGDEACKDFESSGYMSGLVRLLGVWRAATWRHHTAVTWRNVCTLALFPCDGRACHPAPCLASLLSAGLARPGLIQRCRVASRWRQAHCPGPALAQKFHPHLDGQHRASVADHATASGLPVRAATRQSQRSLHSQPNRVACTAFSDGGADAAALSCCSSGGAAGWRGARGRTGGGTLESSSRGGRGRSSCIQRICGSSGNRGAAVGRDRGACNAGGSSRDSSSKIKPLDPAPVVAAPHTRLWCSAARAGID